MSEESIQAYRRNHFPTLYAALPQLPASNYQLLEVPAYTTVFDIGSNCEHYLLLTSGKISVKMLSRSGKSILLYHVKPGESCIITTSCLLGSVRYPTFGQTDMDCTALSIPRTSFNRALETSSVFRQFVFNNLGQRLADVMQRLEEVNFTSVDYRLANALLTRTAYEQAIEITHEMLAEETDSAREVVSRHLKKLEARGLLSMGRGTLRIKNRAALSDLCK